MHMPSERSPRRQFGQSLVELTVALAAMLPLFLAIAMLAKYQDLQQATIAASRLLAFECVVRSTACSPGSNSPALVAEVRDRAFGRSRTGIVTDLSGNAARLVTPDPFWVDRAGRPLIEDPAHITADVRRQRFDSPLSLAAGVAERSFPGAVQLISNAAGPGRFNLQMDAGLLEANVSVQVAASAAPDGWVRRLAPMSLRLAARTAVLTDGWTASQPYGTRPDSVATRVTAGAKLPALEPVLDAAYLPVRGLIAAAGAVGLEPNGGRFAFRSVDVDLVPPDRLAP
jgi:hypothetical protein